MKKLKKLIAGCLTAAMCLATLVGCGSSSGSSSETTGAATTTGESDQAIAVDTGSSTDAAGNADAPGAGATKMGVILVGTRDDYGYNQGLYNCCEQLGEDLGIEVMIKESVPEDSSAQAVMEQLISEGCKIIYATSYGHREYAEEVAVNHPEVAFFVTNSTGQDLDNICCFTSNAWDSAYINGVCAGLMTKTNQIGYIGSFQIPTVISSINAFALGAQSVNPDVTVHAVFTGSWADVGLQTNAVNGMASQNIDVIAQFQDYTKTIVEMCEAAGIYAVGYHVDTSELAPNTFIIGTLDAFVKQEQVIQDTIDGKFSKEEIRGGLAEGMVSNTECSALVPDDVKTAVEEATKKIVEDGYNVFTGPIYKQDGSIAYEEGYEPSTQEIDGMDFFIKGVEGNDN